MHVAIMYTHAHNHLTYSNGKVFCQEDIARLEVSAAVTHTMVVS